MHLGTLSPAPQVVEPITFDWYGSTIRSAENVSDLVLVDFMARFGDVDLDDPRSMGAAMSATRSIATDIIHPDDFEAFWGMSKRNGASSRDVIGLAKSLIEAVADRPTGQSTDSSAGLSTTPENLPATPEWTPDSAPAGQSDSPALEAAPLTA